MNAQVQSKFIETYVEMRRKHHERAILLQEVWQLRSTPEGSVFALTANDRLEQLRLDIEDAKNALNMIADLELTKHQLSYDRELIAIEDDTQAMYDDLRHGNA